MVKDDFNILDLCNIKSLVIKGLENEAEIEKEYEIDCFSRRAEYERLLKIINSKLGLEGVS